MENMVISSNISRVLCKRLVPCRQCHKIKKQQTHRETSGYGEAIQGWAVETTGCKIGSRMSCVQHGKYSQYFVVTLNGK